MDGIDTTGGVANVVPLRASTTPAAAQPAAAATPVASATSQASTAGEVANLISLLADASPPIDNKKVEVIRSLIASGTYPIDQHAIAARMLALDFPGHSGSADA